MLKPRSLGHTVEELGFADHKIVLLSGPRQCGKTTLARMLGDKRKIGVYRNWDQLEFRRIWASNPSSIIPASDPGEVPLVVLDEIHKERRWKRNLKGIYDTLTNPCDLLVTGSARLNVYVKGSDSLLGRHIGFRLHPFSIRELEEATVLPPDAMLEHLINRARSEGKLAQERLALLMVHGPFPEPLFAQNDRKTRLWRRNREQLIVREDLRDLSRIPELGRVEMATALLPERVGSLFSLASLARDLETSIPTVKRWMNYLKELYYVFEVKPYSRGIWRSLRREGKVYLWDYAGIKDEAARFENLVACHLLKTCHYWTDTGEGVFELCFLRDKEKREVDFLIVRDGRPWLPIEVKLTEQHPSPSFAVFGPALPCRFGLQITRQPGWVEHRFGDACVLVGGAAEVLGYFA